MTQTTNCLASHVETALGGSKFPKALAKIRPNLRRMERASSSKNARNELTELVADIAAEPITEKAKRQRIRLLSAAAGSVLAGFDIHDGWNAIAAEVCENQENDDFADYQETIAHGLEEGAEHPWKQAGGCTDKHVDSELPNHSGSPHYMVLRALDQAKAGNPRALHSGDVLVQMALMSPKAIAEDAEIADIKAQMRAAKLSVPEWEAAISKHRREKLDVVYEDRMASGRPNPKSRRNVKQFLDTIGAAVWFDDFSKKTFIECEGETTQLDDDTLRDWMFLMREKGLPIDKDPASDALLNLALQNKRHPVREYLNGLKWDEKERVDTWLADYAGAKDTKLNRAFGRKFLIGAIRRIMRPGVKLRAMPILEGEQNIGKSLVFKTLAVRDEWYTDSLELGCDPKEVIELTEGKWIVETPELSGMAKRDVEHVKAMVSRDVDKARLAYGRFSTEVARQFVLGGTTNTDEYLKDRTGNTRFWGVKVGRPRIKALKRDRDQLWAEAVQIEATDEPHWLDTAELQELARKSAQAREEQSPIEQKWIELFRGAHKHGDIFIPTDELYVAMDLKETAKRTQAHKTSMHYAAKHTGWSLTRKRIDEKRPYGFVPEGADAQTARIATYDRLSERLKVPKVKRRGDGLGQS